MKNIQLILVLFGLVGSFFYGDYSINKRMGNNGIYYENVEYTDNVEFYGVDGLNIRYTGELYTPGDYFELDFDVVNPTRHDVEISKCTYQKTDPFIEYQLVYEDGSEIKEGDTLKKGERKRLKYRVSYINRIQSDSYEFDSSFYINYEQII